MSYRIRFYRERYNMNHSYYTGTDDVYMIVRVDDEENLINVLNSLLEHYEGETYSVWQEKTLLVGGAFDPDDVIELRDQLGVAKCACDIAIEKIEFQSKKYMTAKALDPETGEEIMVADEMLLYALIVGGEFVSPEAERIDESISFYVPRYLFYESQGALLQYVNINMD